MRLNHMCAGVLLAFVVGTQSAGAQTNAATTLHDAAARGAVDFELRGLGGSSGASVRVTVKRAPGAPDPLIVTIPAGTVLQSADRSAQNMVVDGLLGIDLGAGRYRPADRLVLRGAAVVTAILSAFCAEFEKDNPSTATTFTLQAPHPTLACIAREGSDLTVAAKQAAIWMATDRITYSHMSEKFDVTPTEWNSARAVVDRCVGHQNSR